MNAHDLGTPSLSSKLKDSWAQMGIRGGGGVSPRQIESFESRYQVRLPPDLSEYFRTVNGMEYGQVDSNMFSFLPLDAVKRIPEELANFGGIPDYREIMQSLADPHCWFVIVDYFITSGVCAIRLSHHPGNNAVLWIHDGSHYRVVAASFSQFLSVYMANPLDLLS